MKLFIISFLIIAGWFIAPGAVAQETCKVLMPSISGQYEGECKKGKANGNGKAEGTDQYLGEFKNGLPHGKGVYRWKNGNFYDGEWSNGKRDGDGGMAYKRNGKTDSVITGFWKKDAYVGKFEKPYIIHTRTLHFSLIEVKKNKSALENTITIEVGSTTGGTYGLKSGGVPKPELTDIQIIKGSYVQSHSINKGDRISSRTLLNVIFPFQATYRIGNQEVAIEILEEGNWLINLRLNE